VVSLSVCLTCTANAACYAPLTDVATAAAVGAISLHVTQLYDVNCYSQLPAGPSVLDW